MTPAAMRAHPNEHLNLTSNGPSEEGQVMRYVIKQDQAVWERAQWAIEVPDDMPESEREDYVREQIDDGQGELLWTQITTSVEGIDSEWFDCQPEES